MAHFWSILAKKRKIPKPWPTYLNPHRPASQNFAVRIIESDSTDSDNSNAYVSFRKSIT